MLRRQHPLKQPDHHAFVLMDVNTHTGEGDSTSREVAGVFDLAAMDDGNDTPLDDMPWSKNLFAVNTCLSVVKVGQSYTFEETELPTTFG